MGAKLIGRYIWTQGETFEEVLKNSQEAIHCYVEGLRKLGEPIPKPKTKMITIRKPETIYTVIAA